MITIRTKAEMRAWIGDARRQGRSVALVPTMGAFHAGHHALMAAARANCNTVVVSLFVNPAQFEEPSDLAAYPRSEERDAADASARGVDVLFAPSQEEVYPRGFATSVRVAGLSDVLEGAERGPGHFAGVCTVVAKLLNIVAPDVAFFGQKDAQQVAVLRRMVEDLDLPVRLAVVPTVREPDGLALSSRNTRLDAAERARAIALSRALRATEAAIGSGERDAVRLREAALAAMAPHGVDPEYLALVDPDSFEPVLAVNGRVLVAVAARLGDTRLIDNALIQGSVQEDPARPERSWTTPSHPPARIRREYERTSEGSGGDPATCPRPLRRGGVLGPAPRVEKEPATTMSSPPRSDDSTPSRSPVTLMKLAEKRALGEPIVMVTAYDHPSALAVEAAGVDIVLVGDSAANTVLGYPDTVPVTVEELLMLSAAVRRGLKTPLLVGDLPFGSYEASDAQAITTAHRFVKEAGCHAVKLEGGGASADRARAIVRAGVPVMGHVGLTPQTATALGGYRAQGRTAERARDVLDDALALQNAGCFAIVFEAIPSEVTDVIMEYMELPSIGIGAGASTDGQVLVLHDLLAIHPGFKPKFVKEYAAIGEAMVTGVTAYAEEVRNRTFPGPQHSYGIAPEELERLKAAVSGHGSLAW